MTKNSFEIKDLPEISDCIKKVADEKIKIINSNYVYLIRDLIIITNFELNTNRIKPLIMYDAFFLLELTLKYYLIRYSDFNVKEIEEKGHNIVDLIKIAKDYGVDADELNFLLQKFRNKEMHKLDLNNYYNYKYNREIGKDSLIFDYECSDKEKNNIKDVIEWVKKYV